MDSRLKPLLWIREKWRQRNDEALLFDYRLTKRQMSTWRRQLLQPLGHPYENAEVTGKMWEIYTEVYEMERRLFRLKSQMSNRAMSEVIKEELEK